MRGKGKKGVEGREGCPLQLGTLNLAVEGGGRKTRRGAWVGASRHFFLSTLSTDTV